MSELAQKIDINWYCKHTWRRASYNTMWCLLGCSIGDFGTIAYFQFMGIAWPVLAIMTLAIINGLITSILLETVILFRQTPLKAAFQPAIGMSLISMVSMEAAMNWEPVYAVGLIVLFSAATWRARIYD